MQQELDLQPSGDYGDGIDRRGMLECMAWVGTGLLWTLSGGIPTSRVLGKETDASSGQAAASRSSRSATATSAFPRRRTTT